MRFFRNQSKKSISNTSPDESLNNKSDSHDVATGNDAGAAAASTSGWLSVVLAPRAPAGHELPDQIAQAVGAHVVLPPGSEELIALFILHCHAHDASQFSPLLAIESPDTGCGKTTLLRVLQAMTPRPLLVSSLTSAGLYRTITRSKHTLLIDEGDTIAIGKKELRGILDGGHFRGSAHVLRADGIFDVWCPKAIALIGTLPSTLRDRSIRVPLKRKLRDESVAVLDQAALVRLSELRDLAAVWGAQQHNRLAAANPMMPPELTNRAADNFTPLLAIADAAGGRWPELARQMAVRSAALAGPDASIGVMLLVDVRRIFRRIETDRIPTTELIEGLKWMDDRPWAEWQGRQGITPSQVANLLRPYGISPKTLRFPPMNVVLKGYSLADFEDAFNRYL
jgi:Protein of unknown function (DUF3631)